MAVFLYRSFEWRKAQDTAPVEALPEFVTEENALSRYVKHFLVDNFGEQWPWLRELWDYTNHPDFYFNDFYQVSDVKAEKSGVAATGFGEIPSNDIFGRAYGRSIRLYNHPLIDSYDDSARLAMGYLIIHELSHNYLLAYRDITDNPAPAAVALLYFTQFKGEPGCNVEELYAVAISYAHWVYGDLSLIDAQLRGSSYWMQCSATPDFVTDEALKVARQALAGEMPDWFYETFQRADGSLDYEAIWAAVLKNSFSRGDVAPGLRHSFGGYCSEQITVEELYNRVENTGEMAPSEMKQPWRDGGCQAVRSILEARQSSPD